MNLRLTTYILLIFAFSPPIELRAERIKLSDLAGWQSDDAMQIWSTWKKSCSAFRKKQLPAWIKVCDHADKVKPNPENIKHYFETHFKLSPIINKNGSDLGTITGYYEPVLQGSLKPNGRYKYPVYQKPDNPALQALSRRQIENQPQKLKDNILLWTIDPYDLFFLHVQGSGRVQLTDGQQKSLVYAGNNGHKYTSIGKVLINLGELEKEKVSLTTLKKWLNDNPVRATGVLQQNKRYIYFNLVETPEQESGPRGSLNVPLTPGRSIAIDPNHVTLGSPIFLQTTLPSETNQRQPFNRLMFAQDTGAAIKGQIRADVFFGRGNQAEFLAGNMNQQGKMYLLEPHL